MGSCFGLVGPWFVPCGSGGGVLVCWVLVVCRHLCFGKGFASSALVSAPMRGPATDQLHAMGSSASCGQRSMIAGASGVAVSATGFAAEEGFDSDEPKEK